MGTSLLPCNWVAPIIPPVPKPMHRNINQRRRLRRNRA